jgi:hypothetical protein
LKFLAQILEFFGLKFKNFGANLKISNFGWKFEIFSANLKILAPNYNFFFIFLKSFPRKVS